jgi:hypothetical protein
VPRKSQGANVLLRTARVELRVTPAQRERCFGLLRSGADLWAAVLELNALRRQRGHAPIVNYQDLCRELARAGPGCAGELSSVGARSILRRSSDAWFCAAAARRGGDGRARFPQRRRPLMPSRYYAGTVCLGGFKGSDAAHPGRSVDSGAYVLGCFELTDEYSSRLNCASQGTSSVRFLYPGRSLG